MKERGEREEGKEDEREQAEAVGGGQPQLRNDTFFCFVQYKIKLSFRLWKTLCHQKLEVTQNTNLLIAVS